MRARWTECARGNVLCPPGTRHQPVSTNPARQRVDLRKKRRPPGGYAASYEPPTDSITGQVVRDAQQLEEFGLEALQDEFLRAKTALLALTDALAAHRR